MSETIAREDPAYAHYFWKIAAQKQTLFHRAHMLLVNEIGQPAANHLVLRAARRVRNPRRMMLAAALLLLVPAITRGAAVALLPLIVIAWSGRTRRRLRVAADLLGNANDEPLGRFPPRDVRRALRRHRRRVPACALHAGPLQAAIAGHLGERDPDVVETAGKLALEFEGSAVELLDAARRLC